jgi:hypothetical protein
MSTKEAFHQLIDKIKNEEILRGYFKLIERLNSYNETELWTNLSKTEKEELLLSYEESFDKHNLISHEEVKKQNAKWLKK